MNHNHNCFVLRQYYGNDQVTPRLFKDIQEGRLRQGWGISGLSLFKNGKQLDPDEWARLFQTRSREVWKEELSHIAAKRRHAILSIMLEMEAGDIVVVPKQPDNSHFVVCTVKEKYAFDSRSVSDRAELDDDFRHVVEVRDARPIDYLLSEDSMRVAARFRAYQKAVNHVYGEDFICAVKTLLDSSKPVTGQPSLQQLIRKSLRRQAEEVLRMLRTMKPSDLESTVRRLFEEADYEFVQTHIYDREGGDVDLRFSLKLPLLDGLPDQTGITINVQVKKKEGVDEKDSEGIEQLVRMSEGPAINILVSTADSFTSECQKRAAEENVILVAGIDLGLLMMKYFPHT